MDNFKVILKFTLERRIKNRTFITVNCLLGILVALLFCCDFYIPILFPTWDEKPSISCNDTELCSDLAVLLVDFELVEEEKLKNSEHYFIDSNESYDVWVDSNVDMLNVAKIEMALRQREELKLISEGVINLKSVYVHSFEEEESSANTWGFLIITTIYFFALSFAGSIANDIVYEKATRMMEIILTSTSASIHLMAKLVGGWMALLIQIVIFVLEIFICFVIRIGYDNGRGIIKVLNTIGFAVNMDNISFQGIAQWISSNSTICFYLLIALVLMFLGILLVQSVLVILSSHISNIEEAGNIQSPFYLILMGVYYLTLFVNNKESMSHGIGRILSILPFFSMLCMPCRIFYHSIPWSDLFLSICCAVMAILVTLVLGTPIYQKGVLDYSSSNK